jgi:hypothetical protein
VTQTPAAGTISAGIRIVTSADAVEAWGAHLYRSDLGGMKANPSAYPMYNPTTPKNLLGFTESLTTGWTNSNTTDAIASEVNPVGLTGAVDVAATAGNGTLLGSVSLLASPYTFSVYLKRKTGGGTVEITVDGTTYVTAAVTGTWTRFSTTLTPTAGTKTPGIRLVTSGDAVYAWGAQLSDSASLDTYVPNYGAAPTAAAYYGPRLDFDPVTLAAKGLLVEEARTNFLVASDQFDAASWTKPDATVSTNSVVSPDGTSSAERLTPSGATPIVRQTYTTTTAGSYIATVWLKSSSATNVTISLRPSGAGSPVSVVCAVTSAWQRFSVSITAASGITAIQFWIEVFSQAVDAWGAQLEAGSFATSYIPTGAATATRSADVASVSTQAFPYGATEGTLVANLSWNAVSSVFSYTVTISDNSLNNLIGVFTQNESSGTGGRVRISGTDSALLYSSPAAIPSSSPTKQALTYKVNDFAYDDTTSAVITDTTGDVPQSLSTLSLNTSSRSSYHIRQITYIPRRLSNTELQTRTA